MRLHLLPALMLAALPLAATADDAPPQAPPRIYEIPRQLQGDGGFLAGHPDLDYRLRGAALDRKQQYASAYKEYRRAAHYGDKPSQARIGEMYWNGEGVAKDPVQAFLWMALAAERGQREFSLLKLYYWQQLDPAQQASARGLAPDMEAAYGDKAARRRLGLAMRREQHRTAGGLLGYNASSGPLSLGNGIDPELYFAEAFWKPERYLELSDRIFEQHYQGRVEVGDVEQVPAEPAKSPSPGG